MSSIDDIGIDIGTSRVQIVMRGEGIMLDEPNLAIVDRKTRHVFSIGNEAEESLGRLPQQLQAVRPLRDGVINDYELMIFLLQSFVKKVIGKHIFKHPKAVLTMPTGVNDLEKHSLSACLLNVGLRRASTLNHSLAAALGAGLDLTSHYATLLVDISAGVTDVAVIASGKVAVSDCVNVGGSRFDESIIYYIRKKYNLLIGEKTAEDLKKSIGSALNRAQPQYMDVTGRNLLSGLPKTQRITSDDITEAIQPPLVHLVQSIHSVLEHTPDELAADIAQYGMLLSGGGSLLYGVGEAIAQTIQIPYTITESPSHNAVMGCAAMLEHLSELGHLLDRYSSR